MGAIKKITDKLYLKQWGIGLIRANIRDVIREKRTDLRISWIPIPDKNLSYADPFILKASGGKIEILYEQMTSFRMDGHIAKLILNEDQKIISQQKMLETGSHLSYPFLFKEKGKTYVFPENALGGKLIAYEIEEQSGAFIHPTVILDIAVLDATILYYQQKYWLFCTLLGDQLNSALHIYCSDSLLGHYTAHPGNPVKTGLKGSRPAGDFIEVDGELYRPAQNCTNYYGESLTIYKLNTLSSSSFEEEIYMEIRPKLSDEFNYGLHTINTRDNYIVVDGQKSHFQPVQQLLRKIRNLVAKT